MRSRPGGYAREICGAFQGSLTLTLLRCDAENAEADQDTPKSEHFLALALMIGFLGPIIFWGLGNASLWQ